jgi:beta-galactosidase
MPRNQFLDWSVANPPGTLTAIGYNQGKVAARYTLHKAGAPSALRLIAELPHLSADGEAVAPVRVEVVDAHGEIVPDADPLIRFSASGAGTLAGVANGDPASHEINSAIERRAFRGLAMVMIRAADHAGAIIVTARSEGLAPASLTLQTSPAPMR